MKKKTIALSKKLILDKEVISILDNKSMQAIAGGATIADDNGCVGSNHCDLVYTKGRDCIQVTRQNSICRPILSNGFPKSNY